MSIINKLVVFVTLTALVFEHLFNGPSRTMTWVTETLLFIMGYLITAFNPESFGASGCDFWEERNLGEVARKASSFTTYVHEKQCVGRIAGNEENGPGEKYAFVLVILILLYSILKIFPPSFTSSDSAHKPETDSDSSTGLAQPSLPGSFHTDHEESSETSTDVHLSNKQAMVEVKEDTKQELASDSDSDIGLSQLLFPYPVLNIHEDTVGDLVRNEKAVKEVNEKPGEEKKSEKEQKPGKEQKSDSDHSIEAAEFSPPGAFIDFHQSMDTFTTVNEAKRKARKAHRASKEKLTLDDPQGGTTEVNTQNLQETEASQEKDPQQVLLMQLSEDKMNLTRELAWERRSKDIILDALYIEKQQVEGLRNELNVPGGIGCMKAFSYADNKLWETRQKVDSLRVSLREANKQLKEREDAKSGMKRGLFMVEETSPAKRQKVGGVSDQVAEMMEEMRFLRENNNKLILSLGEKDTKLNEQVTRISDLFEEGRKLLDQKEDLEKEVYHLQQLVTDLEKSFFQQAHQTRGAIDDGEFERTMSGEIDEWEQGHGSRIVDVTDEDEAL